MFEKREKEKRALEKARNELESYIVNTRSQLSDGDVVSVWPAAAIGLYSCMIFGEVELAMLNSLGCRVSVGAVPLHA